MNAVELLQRKANKFKWLSILVVVFLYIPIAYTIHLKFNIPNRVIRYIALPFFLIAFNMYKNRKRAFILAFNETVTNQIVNNLRPQWNHFADRGISEEIIFKTYLIQKRPYAFMSNLMTGSIGNVGFQFCHVETSKKNNLAGRLPSVAFKGYFFEFDFPKYNRLAIHVHPPTMKDFGEYLKIPKKTTTDAAEFDKTFRTYCDDPIELRYVLTLSLMARMIDLQAVLPGHVSFCFEGGKVYIAIRIKGSSIEPKVSKKINVNDVEETHRVAFEMIERFVEELKLQLELWNREVS